MNRINQHIFWTTMLILMSTIIITIIVFFDKVCLFLGSFFIWLWRRLC